MALLNAMNISLSFKIFERPIRSNILLNSFRDIKGFYPGLTLAFEFFL